MAKNDNLNDFLADVANAIRLKKGTSDLINPQDFRKEIESISGSGGGGDSNIEYLDISQLSDGSKQEFMSVAYLVKAKIYENKVVLPVYMFTLMTSDDYVVEGVALDVNIEIFSADLGNAPIKIKDIYPNLISIPRLTKEQFYSLE